MSVGSHVAPIHQASELVNAEAVLAFAVRGAHFDSIRAQLDAAEPLSYLEPHATFNVSLEQYQTCRAEHAALESEVDAFDGSDLPKWRGLARTAVGRNMSRTDADLVSVVLKTLLSLDRLQSRLKQRGRSLDLMSLRIRCVILLPFSPSRKGIFSWDENMQAAQKELDSLTEMVLDFVLAARWSKPAQPDIEREAASEVNETSIQATIEAAEKARRDHCAVLGSAVTTLQSRIKTSQHGHLIKAGRFLDELIDGSPTPLPDVFLDMQEAVEKGFASLKGWHAFSKSLAAQWRAADTIFWSIWKCRQRCHHLCRQVESALCSTPAFDMVSSFQCQLEDLRKDIDGLVVAIPDPVHAAMHPEQTGITQKLLADLQEELCTTEAAYTRAASRAEHFRAWCTTRTSFEALQDRINDQLHRLSEVRHDLEQVYPLDASTDAQRIQHTLDQSKEEWQTQRQRWQKAATSMQNDSLILQTEGAKAIIELRRFDEATEARRNMASWLDRLAEATNSLRSTAAETSERLSIYEVAVEVRVNLEEARNALLDWINQARGRVRIGCCQMGTRYQDQESSILSLPNTIQGRIKEAETRLASFETASSSSNELRYLLTGRLRDCNTLYGDASRIEDLLQAIVRQRIHVAALREKIQQASINLQTLSDAAMQAKAVTAPRLRDAFERLRVHSESICSRAHLGVPFVASAERHSLVTRFTLAIDVYALDTDVRSHLNVLLANLASKVDSVHRLIANSLVPTTECTHIRAAMAVNKVESGLFSHMRKRTSISGESSGAHCSSPELDHSYSEGPNSTPTSSILVVDRQEQMEKLDREIAEWLDSEEASNESLPIQTDAEDLCGRAALLTSKETGVTAAMRNAQLIRIEELVRLGDLAQHAERTFDAVLDAIDGVSEGHVSIGMRRTASSRSLPNSECSVPEADPEKVALALTEARRALEVVQLAALPLAGCGRARMRLAHIQQVYDEIHVLAEEQLHESVAPARESHAMGLHQGKHRLKRSTSELILNSGASRNVIAPSAPEKRHHKSRSVSITTTTRIPSRPQSRASSRAGSRPASRIGTLPPMPKSASGELSVLSGMGHGRPTAKSMARTTANHRVFSGEVHAPRSAEESRRVSKYHADPRRRLDVEVGKIVNALPIHIPIRSAQGYVHGTTAGSYWIGDPEPKLFYCRILRSQRVMVRIGGGYCDLEQFLRKNWGHLFALPRSRPSALTAEVRASVLEQASDDAKVISAPLSRSASGVAQSVSPTRLAHTMQSNSPSSAHKSPSRLEPPSQIPELLGDGSPRRQQHIWR